MSSRLAKFLPQGSLGRRLSLLVGSAALGQLLKLALAPLLTRLYDPRDFGVLAAYISILTLIGVVSTFCYEMAIPLAKKDTEAVNVTFVALGLLVVTSTLVSFAIAWVGPLIVAPLKTPGLVQYLWMLPIGVSAGGLFTLGNAWAIRRERYVPLARGRFLQNAGQAIGQLVLAPLGCTGLLLGDLLGRILSGVLLFSEGLGHEGQLLTQTRLDRMRDAALRFRRFPFPTTGSLLLNAVGVQVPTLMLAAFYGPGALGLYALCQRVIGLPLSLVGDATAQVYLGEFARSVRTDLGAVRGLFLKTTVQLLCVSAVPFAVLGLTGPWLFGLVFGPAWREAGTFLQLMTPMLFAQFATNPLAGTLGLLERHDLLFLREVLRLAMMGGAIWASHQAALDAQGAIALLSTAGFLSYLAYGLIGWIAIADSRETRPAVLPALRREPS
ncbi:MAG TPA: lipopolysaccharide biosynthesis protein [Oscillatoriaceae cyanobacterium]